MRLQLTDRAGNVFASQISTFTYDTTAPTVNISSPTNNNFYSAVLISSANWSGTTIDNGANPTGLSTVTLTLQDISASSTPLSNVPAGNNPASWTYVSTITLVDDHQYQLDVTARDNANISGSASVTFFYDVRKPTSAVTSPTPGYLTSWTSISGTASDRVGGPAHPSLLSTGAVSVAVQQVGLGWWNGTDFNGGAPNYNLFNVVNTTTTGASPNTWIASLPGSFTTAIQSGTTYFIVSRSTDNVGNAEFGTTAGAIPPSVGVTVLYDTAPAGAVITLPVNGISYNHLTTITGTAGDAVSGLNNVQVTIKNVNTNQFYDTSNDQFDLGAASWIVVTGSAAWSYTTPPKITGGTLSGFQFRVFARAINNAGVIPADPDFNTGGTLFRFDKDAPVSTITIPTSGSVFIQSTLPTSISGTANDTTSGGSGIAASGVKIRILRSDGQLFNGVSYGNDDASFPLNASYSDGNPGSWTLGVSTSLAWQDNYQYSIISRAQDITTSNGAPNTPNFQSPYSTITFTVDMTAPQTTITQPADNSAYSNVAGHTLNNIIGTSTDPNTFKSGVAKVELSVGQFIAGTTHYFNGTNFGSATTEYMLTATSTSPWSYWATGLNPAGLVDGATYRIHAHSTDVAGNVDIVTTTSTFFFDKSLPVSTITFPINGDVQENPPDIEGTAFDVGPAGLQKVQISLRLDNPPTSQIDGPAEDFYFDGSSFTSTSEVWLDATGGTPQSWNFPTPNIWISGKRYWVKAQAIDRAGNVQSGGSVGAGNNFIVTLPASKLQVIVDTQTTITAGVGRNVTVNALDSGNNVAITYQGTVRFSIDSGGPETPLNGLPDDHIFQLVEQGSTVVSGFVPIKAGNRTLNVSDVNDPQDVATGSQAGIIVVPNTAVKLQTLVGGESNAAGTATGKNPATLNLTAGTAIGVTVNAVDQYWNVNTSSSPSTVNVVTNDTYATPPGNRPLLNGTTFFSAILVTAGAHQNFTASGAGTPSLSSDINVTAAALNQMFVVLPGETYRPGKYQGSPLGKDNTPSPITAGQTLLATVYGVDAFYNTKTSASNPVWVNLSSDTYAVKPSSQTLVSGTTVFSLVPIVAGTQVVQATSTLSNPTYTTAGFLVNAASADRIQILLPNQSLLPGSVSGSSGTPSALTVGTTYQVTVLLTDQFYNQVTGGTMPDVQIQTNDGGKDNAAPFQWDPVGSFTLVGGSHTYPVDFVIKSPAGGFDITASVDGNTLNTSVVTSTKVVVNPGTGTQLLLLLPGESAAPGTAVGKTGTPQALKAGFSVPLTVAAVDNYWNVQPAANRQVSILSNDSFATIQAPHPLGGSGQTTFTYTPRISTNSLILSAVDSSGVLPQLSTMTESGLTVNFDTMTAKIQILMPGETPAPGKPPYGATITGSKNGQPDKDGNNGNGIDPFVAGQNISVTARLVDFQGNLIDSNFTMPELTLTTPNDIYAVPPSSDVLQSGTLTFNIQPVKAGTQFVTASDDASILSTVNSATFSVVANSYARLQVLLPGQNTVPGLPPYDGTGGKNGTIDLDPLTGGSQNAAVAGRAFVTTVVGEDNYYNPVSTNATVYVQVSQDANMQPAISTFTLQAGTTQFPMALVTKGAGRTVSASDSPSFDGLVGIADGNSNSFSVGAGPAAQLLVVAGAETIANGKPPYDGTGGRSGSPGAATAGVGYTIKVYRTDALYNDVTAGADTAIRITTEDPFDGNDPDSSQSILAGSTFLTLSPNRTFQTATATGWRVVATDISGTGLTKSTSTAIPVNADTNPAHPHQLLVLTNNEVASPGNTAQGGKTGGKTAKTAGVAFPITILATDQFWNQTGDNPTVAFTSLTDPYATLPGAFNLSVGSGTRNVTFLLATSTAQVTATAASPSSLLGITYAAYTSSNIVVNSAGASHLQVLVPGETAQPGNVSGGGKVGTPDSNPGVGGNQPFVAGTSYAVTVNSVDPYFNLVSAGVNAQVHFVSSETHPNVLSDQPLTNGTTQFALKFFTANTAPGWNVIVSTSPGSDNLTSDTSPVMPVVAANASQLLIVAPGETYDPGNVAAGGKTSSPIAQKAGHAFNLTVRGVDPWFNTDTLSGAQVRLVSTDTYANDYDQNAEWQPLQAGATVFAIAGAHQAVTRQNTLYTASDMSTGLTVATDTITVNADDADRILVLLPGETPAEGKPPYTATDPTGGKSIFTPNTVTAGVPIQATVRITDQFWNQTSSSPIVNLTAPDDPNATGIGNVQLVNGTTFYNVTLFKAGDYNGSTETLHASAIGFNFTYITSTFTVLPASSAGSPRFLRILVNPEQPQPGYTTLKTGSPIGPSTWDSHFVAGTTITFRVDATDTWGNLISTNSSVTLVTDDPNAKPSSTINLTLSQGTTQFAWNWVTRRTPDGFSPTTPAFTAATATASGFAAAASEHLVIDADRSKSNLQILIQGEQIAEGTGSYLSTIGGKTGAPQPFVAGSTIPITVRTVDDYWNLVESPNAGTAAIQVTATDPNVTNPLIPTANTTNGAYTDQVSVVLVTQSPPAYTLTASTASGPNFKVNISSPISITAAPLAKLQILAPGESPAPGTATGKTGTPTTQVSNVSFNVPAGNLRAVDAYYNTVSTNGAVTVTMADPYGAPLTQNVNISGGSNSSAFPISLAISTQTFANQVLYANGFSLPTSTSSIIPVNVSTATHLQLLLPGETALPGSPTGKSGSVQATFAGSTYTVTVNLVDVRFNKVVQPSQPTVHISMGDPYATVSPNNATLNINTGQGTFNVFFQAANTAPGWQIFASTQGSAVSASSDTSNFVVVSATTSDHLLLVLPGETATPGSPRGFLGSPSGATAGVPYISSVTVTDRFYNTKTDLTPQVKMVTNDPNSAANGASPVILGVPGVPSPTLFPMTFYTAASSWTLTVSTVSGGSVLISTTSDQIYVHPALPTKLQVLVPGQTAAPGQLPYDDGRNGGYTGHASTETAGVGFAVTVNLVDPYFNRAESLNTFVKLTSSDPFANPTISAMPEQGTAQAQTVFNNVALVTRNPTGWFIYASTSTTAASDPYAMGISTTIPVQSNAAATLLVLAPGEISQEGNFGSGGKVHGPNPSFTVGTTYYVEVRAVDSFYNIVTTTAPIITLTSDDPFAASPSTDSPHIMSSGTVTMPFMLKTAEVFPNGVQLTHLTAAAAGFTSNQSGTLTMAPTSYNNIQILVPPQIGVPGSATGKNAVAISTQSAGVMLSTITVRAVDRFFNVVPTQPSNIQVLASDPHDDRPGEYQANPTLNIPFNSSGTWISTWTFATANLSGWTLSASGPGALDTSPNIPVKAGTQRLLQIVLPGETPIPGSGTYTLNGTGRSGPTTPWTSGVSSNVIINIVDKHFNVVPNASANVTLSNNTDVFASSPTILVAGTTTYAFTLFVATGSTSFTASAPPVASGLDPSSATVVSSTFSVQANSAVKLQILVPGEVSRPGSATGKSSVGISTAAAGVSLPVTVNAVDLNWNVVSAGNQIKLTTNDPYAPAITLRNLFGGTTTFPVIFAKANPGPGGWAITASTNSGSALTDATSAVVPVKAGPATRLQFILPNQVPDPGNQSNKGKTGSPTNADPDHAYNVTVRLTDDYYNLESTGNALVAPTMPGVQVLSTDPNDVESTYVNGNPQPLDPNTGSATFGALLRTTGTWTFNATDTGATFTSYAADTSSPVVTVAGAPTKLLAILQNQTLVPGTVGGVSGSPTNATAGTNYTATIYVTDQYSNPVSTGRNPVFVHTSDLYDVDPGSFNLTGGQVTVTSVTAVTAGLVTLFVDDNDLTAPALTQAASTFTIVSAPASQLQLLVGSEVAVPGSATGKSVAATSVLAGANFNVTVNLTDPFWNPVITATANVQINSSDPNDGSAGPWAALGAKDPITLSITTGTYVFTMPFFTANATGWSLSATDLSTHILPEKTPFDPVVSSSITVTANPSSTFPLQRKILPILPGESLAPGTATGRSGSVSTYTVGGFFNVTVAETDQFFNPIFTPLTNSATVQLLFAGSADPYAQIGGQPFPVSNQPINPGNGLFTFGNLQLFKASSFQFVPKDNTVPSHSPSWVMVNSSVFTSSPQTAANTTKLLMVISTETATPGSGTPGKTGAVQDIPAGSVVVATVQVVDQYYNVMSTHTQENVAIFTSDQYASVSATQTLVSVNPGTTFTIQMRTAGAQTATAFDTNQQDGSVTWTPSVSPAAGTFNVVAGPAARLVVVVPGETLAPGKPPYDGTGGRNGSPTPQVAGSTFSITVYQTDAQYNPVLSVNPLASVLMTGNDPGVSWTGGTNPAALFSGSGFVNFTVTASSAQPSFVLTASTDTSTPAGTQNLLPGNSNPIRVWPGPRHHLKFSGLPTEVKAGNPFDGCVTMYDQYQNVLSSGPNVTSNPNLTLKFDAETSTNSPTVIKDTLQNPAWLPGTTTYNLLNNQGQLCLTSYFSLRAQGSHWLKAYDNADVTHNLITTELTVGGTVYSVRPFILVDPGDPSRFVLNPISDVTQDAGSNNAFGNYLISAQLADAFDNFASSPGITVQISTYNVTGTAGIISKTPGGSAASPPPAVWSDITDSSGSIGKSTNLYYYVSHIANNSAQITFTATLGAAVVVSTTGHITTTGGTPSQLVILSGPTTQVAGTDPSGLQKFTIQRRDDFGNPTTKSPETIALDIMAAQQDVHTAKGFTVAHGDYEFIANGLPAPTIDFNPGVSQVQVVYYDVMASTPVEDGRTGAWTLRFYDNGTTFDLGSDKTTWDLVVTPAPTTQVAFHNPKRTLFVGGPLEPGGDPLLSYFSPELQDTFGNPTPAAADTTVTLTSSRSPSLHYDTYGFSLSSATINSKTPPAFITSTTTVLIASTTWSTTFYYLDTTASENYSVPSSSPAISASAPGLIPVAQAVNLIPRFISTLNFLTAPSVLTAGTTSQVFTLETSDLYGNPSAVLAGDGGGPTVAFDITSNSSGTLKFATPLITSPYVNGSGSAYITVGQSTTTFYMVDTLAGSHQLTVQPHQTLPWGQVQFNYTVGHSTASQLRFITPSRYLVAGTTIQFEPDYTSGITTDTVITVQSADPYGNTSPISSTTVVAFYIDNATNTLPTTGGRGSLTLDPTDVANFFTTDISGAGNVLQVPFSKNTSQVSMWYFDMDQGTHTMVAHDNQNKLTDARITHFISPSPAAYFTIEPIANAATPMPVNTLLPFGTLTARDQFGNIATGDPKNGQYYVGTASFTTSGSTATVTLVDTNAPSIKVSSYTFKISDAGVYSNLLILDSIQETLRISATDYVTPVPPLVVGNNHFDASEHILRGWTGEARTVPVHSLGDIVTAGIVVTPTDLSPDPTSGVLGSLKWNALNGTPWQGKNQIKDGDGTLNLPSGQQYLPVPMLMLTFKLLPTIYSSSTIISRIQLTKRTDMGPGEPPALGDPDVYQVALYYDSVQPPANVPQFEQIAGGSPVDTLVATTTLVGGVATFNNLNISISTGQIKNYFVAVRISSNVATLPANIGFRIANPNQITVNGLGVASNNFPIVTSTSPVVRTSPNISVQGQDIAAFWKPGGAVTASTQSYVEQGVTAVGMLRVGVWTDAFQATINGLNVYRNTGTGLDSDVTGVRVYADSNGTGILAPNDLPISSATTFVNTIATITFTTNQVVTPTTSYFFIAYDINPSATNGTQVAIIPTGNIFSADGNVVGFNPITSSTIPVTSSNDELDVSAVNSGFSLPGIATQGDRNAQIMKLTLRAENPTGGATINSAILTNLRLDRTNPGWINHARDVDAIHLYYDLNNNGVFDSSDTEVTSTNQSFQFAQSPLVLDVDASTTVIHVASTLVFPPPPGRIDIDQEIMTYTGAANGLLTGVTRGAEGTPITTHTTGATVEGQAYLTIVDNTPGNILGGQAIVKTPKNYFVTFDVNYLATTNPNSDLGVQIPTTSYFVVNAPKSVGNQFGLIGLSAPAHTISFINNISPYSDTVVLSTISTPSAAGASLTQGTTAQVISAFTMQTNASRAVLKSMILTRTGTSSDADVAAVKIWADKTGTGFFDPVVDGPPIGSGVFNSGAANIIFDSGTYNTDLNDLTTGPLKIDTALRHLNGYFITYDIATLANPQMTLGVSISSATNTIVVSNPDLVASTNLPAASVMRTIIPSPQVLGVNVQYYFSNASGSYPLPRLQQAVQSADVDVTLDTTTGLAPSGFIVLDTEVLFYNGITNNTLNGVARCQSGSCSGAPPMHSTYTFVNNIQEPNYVGMNYTQGMNNVALMKLTLNDETNFNIRWYRLNLGHVVPGGLAINDSDLTAIKIYDGDPYVRNAAGFVANSNHLMGSGVLNNGTVRIDVNDTSGLGYVLISTTPRVFYVVADVSQSAIANDVFGLNAISPGAFVIGALTAGDNRHSVDPATFPLQTGSNIVSATIDTMTVAFTDILANNVTQAQNNVAVAQLNVRSAANAVTWQGLTVQRTGLNPSDGDVIHVNVWKDINANGSFDDGNPTPLSTLAAPIGANDVTLQVAVSTSYPPSGVLYIDSELIQYTSTGAANSFIGLTRGFLGTAAAAHTSGHNVYGVVNDTLIGDNLVKPGLATNGTNNFTNGTAVMTFVTPQIVPTTADSPNGAGVNYYVTYDINPFVPKSVDLNNDGVYESGEEVTMGALISGTTSFAVLAPKVVSFVIPGALNTKLAGVLEYADPVLFTPDDTIAPNSATQGDLDVPILKFTLKTPVSFARLSSLKVARIGQGAIQTQGSNEDIAQIKIYRDANFNGLLDPAVDVLIGTGTFPTPDPIGTAAKSTVINLFKTETINPTGQTYFIAYDFATGATSNNSEGLTIQDPGWFSGSFVPAGVDSMRADNLPHNSRQISISPLLVRVVGTSIAQPSALQGTTLAPLLAVKITPSINQVVISTLTLTQTGTIQYSVGAPPRVGDGDFSKLYVYLDTNLNGKLDPATDTLVGSIPWGGAAFSNGTAVIPFSSPVTFNTSGGTLLVAADIGTVDGSGASTQGHFAGIQISSAVAITMSPSSALQDPLNVYPVQSATLPIFNFQTVQIGTITMRPDLTSAESSPLVGIYFPNAWVNRQDQVKASWITSPPLEQLPANVGISYQIGVSASNNTSIAPTLTGWVTINTAPPVTLTGLGLSDGSVYYFHVRTLTTINGLALPPSPVSVGTIHVDVSKPAPPGEFLNLPKSAESGVITIQWAPTTTTGPSGLYSYKLRQFVDGSPVPVEVLQTSTPSFTFGSGQVSGVRGSASIHAMSVGTLGSIGTASPLQYLNGETGGARAAGHFYRYQVQTINGAGTASEWSTVSTTIDTGLPSEIITKVSNYPNPVDTRKGGAEGKTCITYLLASDAQVDITIYDLLGYRVMGWSFPAGSIGGQQGANTCVPVGGWDGTNESGQKVSKGGYLAQIKAGGAKGSSTVIRKIGVIH